MQLKLASIATFVTLVMAQAECPTPGITVDGYYFQVYSGLELWTQTNLAQFSGSTATSCARECIHWNKEHTDVKCLAGSLDMDNDICFLKPEGYDKRNTTNVCTLYGGGQPRKL